MCKNNIEFDDKWNSELCKTIYLKYKGELYCAYIRLLPDLCLIKYSIARAWDDKLLFYIHADYRSDIANGNYLENCKEFVSKNLPLQIDNPDAQLILT